jgi:3-hydroxymyristoyl/3-hydroxydecanoyl-(acyl carrier protein) dehydratase
VYSFELDCIIFNDLSFKKVFEPYCQVTNNQHHITVMPKQVTEIISDNELKINIDSFKAGHCTGHFYNFPIVPAVFISNILLQNIKTWLKNNYQIDGVVVDSFEIFPRKAMPIERPLHLNIKIKKITHQHLFFDTEVCCDEYQYGHYFTTIVMPEKNHKI